MTLGYAGRRSPSRVQIDHGRVAATILVYDQCQNVAVIGLQKTGVLADTDSRFPSGFCNEALGGESPAASLYSP